MASIHERLTFEMPASCDVVFDAFHYHHWRAKWDSLVSDTVIDDGAPYLRVGTISLNAGRGLFRALSMKMQFVFFLVARVWPPRKG